MSKQLPIPTHYQAANAGRWDYRPDQGALFGAATSWRQQHKIQPAGSSTFDLHLLLIDCQKDFCLPEGTLYVAGRSGDGAIRDSARMAEFIYGNLDKIKNITTTLDTHFAYQLFFSSFWVDAQDNPVPPYTVITAEMVRSGQAKPNPSVAWWLCQGNYTWLCHQVQFYCEQLEAEGKYALYLWPPHCILGSDGHALVGVIHEARMFHSFVRGTQSHCEVKGGNPLTENYSVLRPEVLRRHDGPPLAQKNTNFLKTLMNADAVVIAGQAASHCVRSSIRDLLDEILAQDPRLAEKVYILGDCMSAVVVPGADFTPQAEQALAEFAAAGMHVVKSTDPIESWPGIRI
jgi:nicotinamidase-related amidase